MKTKTFLLSFFVMISMVIIVLTLFISFQQVQAGSKEATFVLHKRVYQNEKNIPVIQENVQLQENSPKLKDSKGINGAIYAVYNVSSEYWQLASEGKTNDEIVIKLKENAHTLITDTKKVAETVTETDPLFGEGVARMSLPELVMVEGQEKYGVYLFNEESSPIWDELEHTGVFIVSLPINEVNEVDPFIHLYPKSSIHNQVQLTKKLNEKKKNFSYGEPIEYVIESTIPTNTMYLSKYTLLDIYDEPLDYVSGSLRVYINNVEKKDIFTFIEDIKNNKLSLEATGEILRERGITAGSKVKVVYQLRLSDSAVPDVPYDNAVRLSTLFEGSQLPEVISEAPSVETGGKHFVKKDMNEQSKGLALATFLVKNWEGSYLVEKNGTFKWSSNKSDAYQLTSDENGNFSIKGLAYGSYKLVEIKAPDGYKILDEEISFTIESGSYHIGYQATSPLMIVNAKITKESEVPDVPKQLHGENLPQMGDVISTSIIVIGSILLCTTIFYLIRRRKK